MGCGFFMTKDKIHSKTARQKYNEAQKYKMHGSVDYQKSINLLDEADQIEPNNPIILSDRGRTKLNSKIDVDGAFNDMEKAVSLYESDFSREIAYNNLALSYMEICDIKSACVNWKKAGDLGNQYIEKYCDFDSLATIGTNDDDNLVLKLKLIDSTAKIISTHNPANMSNCYAQLSVKNNEIPKIKILKNNLDYGLKSDSSSLFMEALDSKGEPVIFFTSSRYSTYSPHSDKILIPGDSVSKEINITRLHQFFEPGHYKVRIGLRPSNNILGLQKTYYSNWEELKILPKK